MNPFEKILDRLEKYKNNDLIEHDSEQCEHCKRIDCGIGMDCSICVMDKAQEIVQEVAREYNNGWIPCSERLPEYDEEYIKKYNNDKQYIVICKYSYAPTVAHFSKEKIWYYDDFVKFNDVIAWQPLPEPYQQNGE